WKGTEHSTGASVRARARRVLRWNSMDAASLRIPLASVLLEKKEGAIAFLGGPYSNHLALRAAAEDARRRGASALFCLGDLGGFGPNPGKIFPILLEFRILTIAGNYDESLVLGRADCGCG